MDFKTFSEVVKFYQEDYKDKKNNPEGKRIEEIRNFLEKIKIEDFRNLIKNSIKKRIKISGHYFLTGFGNKYDRDVRPVNKAKFGERGWEAQIINKGTFKIPGYWANPITVVSWQVPVGRGKTREKIDILGRDRNNRFVVVEMKMPSGTPLTFTLIESLNYCCSIMKNFNQLKKECLNRRRDREGFKPRKKFPLILVIAPKNYWERLSKKDSRNKDLSVSLNSIRRNKIEVLLLSVDKKVKISLALRDEKF